MQYVIYFKNGSILCHILLNKQEKLLEYLFLHAVWFPLGETRKNKFVGFYVAIKIKIRRSEDRNGKVFG